MSVWTIIVVCLAALGLWYFFPRMPQIAQIVVAILACVACLIIIASTLGFDTGLHF